MSPKSNKALGKIGQPPGTLIYLGKHEQKSTRISLIDYSPEEFSEQEITNIEDCFPYKDKNTVTWINIDGLNQIDTIEKLGNHFNLHYLLLEDVLNTEHRPKVEEYDDHTFLTLKMLGISEDGNSIVSEQVSFVLGENWVISFQEFQGDIFNKVRERIREGIGNIRKMGSDYLLYRLLDTVVDNYYLVTEYFSDSTQALEEQVLKNPEKESLVEIQHMKKKLSDLRKAVRPLREAVLQLEKESKFIKNKTRPYLRDVYEHVIHVNDSMENHRDILASIMDLYMSGVSNKMNEVMKVLTIIATIFIPLTFIAGVYGMNFEHMPELHWKYSYYGIWGLMILIFIGMLFYFKKKDWL
ncbi:MAG: magnesium/cobalt transporter CorA [Flavobacteriales bacterium]|nr:magnesium/cobalt transporter CorA [Flavobacteriales bacterium]